MEKLVLPNDVMMDEVARLLAEGHKVVMIPKGRSMLPFIREGRDKVVLAKPGTLRVGDIVLAYFGNRYVLHRVIRLEGDQVTLMGDGNLYGTEVGLTNEVAGVVTEIITSNGRHRKPSRGWLWRKALPIRKYLLKIYRKWNKLRASSRVSRPEDPRQK